MRKFFSSIPFSLFLISLTCVASGARAQGAPVEPDIRGLRPDVVLLVDTSGSMERAALAPIGVAVPPDDMPTCAPDGRGRGRPSDEAVIRSRWHEVLEALDGTFSSRSCVEIRRPGTPTRHFQPLGTQAADGLLDLYLDRVRFGLMTVDGIFGISRSSSPTSGTGLAVLVPARTYWERLREITGAPGDYSYGTARPVSFPGCDGEFLVNSGARRSASTAEVLPGGFIDPASWIDHRLSNSLVQTSLVTVMPSGGSLLDSLVDDYAESVYASDSRRDRCRDRFAILVSDGQVVDPMRLIGCDAPGHECPYRRAVDTVRDLCAFDGEQCTGPVDGFFAARLAIRGPEGESGAVFMDDIAAVGGTGSALVGVDAASLRSALSRALDRSATSTTSRTTPTHVGSVRSLRSGATASGVGGGSIEITSGFVVGSPWWSGVLEMTRYSCDGPRGASEPMPPVPEDRFQDVLNSRDLTSEPRRLITVVGTDPRSAEGVIIGRVDPGLVLSSAVVGGSVPRSSGESLTSIDRNIPDVTAAHLGLSGGSAASRAAARNALIDWLHGITRPRMRLGDIYHSSPAVGSPPVTDIADEWFNTWRRDPRIIDRPPVVYVGTNDGIMHAFAVEAHTTIEGREISAGEELWGFVPPSVLDRLGSAAIGHQILVDGTPVVRNVFFRRSPGDSVTIGASSPASYHTVLVAGLRGGGPFYFALDVSDPLNPQFLWQFTDPGMGPTLGRPALGQALFDVGGSSVIRAVAVLPGGSAEATVVGTGSSSGWGTCAVPPGAARRGISESPGRTGRRCWDRIDGRSLFVVDVATGEVIREFGPSDLPAPMTGGVSLFLGETGTIATRAYTTDADGVLWRLDMSNRHVDRWTLEAVHDLYWADSSTDGMSAPEPPVVSTNAQGDVVVVVATSDLDNLEGHGLFRVASVTDRVRWTATGVEHTPTLNWEIHLPAGEQVTGPMELFVSRVYFSTFAPPPIAEECRWGGSRIWAVDYLRRGDPPTDLDSGGSSGAPFPAPGMESFPGSRVFDRHFADSITNSISVGVAVTASPTCAVGTSMPDPYVGMRFSVSDSSGGILRLVSHLSGSRARGSALPTSVAVRSIDLPQPVSITRPTDWASFADY